METAIRWDPSSSIDEQRFLTVDVAGRTFKYCKISDIEDNHVRWETVRTRGNVPAFRAFDWSTTDENIVAIGQWSGETSVIRLDDTTQMLSLPIKSQRSCNAVALNQNGLLAAGLERVRNDFCLNVFDIKQNATSQNSQWDKHPVDPLRKLASSEGITSIKFFPGRPDTLVAGVKGTCVRVYDLRDSTGSPAIQQQTPCVHNIAIDFADENYFASAGPPRDTTVHVWDRRSTMRSTAARLGSGYESQSPSGPLLEIKNAFEGDGTANQASIWSLRFNKGRSGCLAMLTSVGQFKIMQIKKDFVEEDVGPIGVDQADSTDYMCPIYTRLVEDAEPAFSNHLQGRAEDKRIVSFDFTNLAGRHDRPTAIILRGDRTTEIYELKAQSASLATSSRGTFAISNIDGFYSNSTTWPGVCVVNSENESRQTNGSDALKDSLPAVALGADPKSHFQPTQSILQATMTAPDLDSVQHIHPRSLNNDLSINNMARRRCARGYLFDCQRNLGILEGSTPLQEVWKWIGQAQLDGKDEFMVSEQIDLSYIGVQSLWNENLERSPGSRKQSRSTNSSSVSDAILTMSNNLDLLAINLVDSSKTHHRALCLHTLGLNNHQGLEAEVEKLVSKQQAHTEAAFLAMLYGRPKLAFKALRARQPTESHKTLSIAIGAFAQGNDDDDWHDMVQDLYQDATDTYTKALLKLVAKSDWSAVLEETDLPLRYRTGIALTHLSDDSLTAYINEQTSVAIASGNIEGVVLTGLNEKAMVLFTNYLETTADLQTAVLAMSFTVPCYIQDIRFSAWRDAYRQLLNSWQMFLERARFDVQSAKLATPNPSRRSGSKTQVQSTLSPPPRQITIRCTNCDQPLDRNPAHTASIKDTSSAPKTASVGSGLHAGSIFHDAKSGTVCPKCGAHLPRCVICDHWVGAPDPQSRGAVAATKNSKSSSTTRDPLEAFPMVCQTCLHVTHGHHAKAWFSKHRVCPAPDCECLCAEWDAAGGRGRFGL
ncbi:hypothetical protein MMC09_001863 [Bachmanniomyces sp. S44760]|nr:hypothetical protein [Bachmanniomyces sp. S44760]